MFNPDDILYEDNHLLIVNKRCGDLVQPDPSGESALEDQIKAFIKRCDAKPGEVRRICSRRRVASFQTSGVLLRGGVETPGLRPGAYGKPAIDARLRVRCLAAAGP